jgi:hypothetical protein
MTKLQTAPLEWTRTNEMEKCLQLFGRAFRPFCAQTPPCTLTRGDALNIRQAKMQRQLVGLRLSPIRPHTKHKSQSKKSVLISRHSPSNSGKIKDSLIPETANSLSMVGMYFLFTISFRRFGCPLPRCASRSKWARSFP